jgi:hypothetical protein
MWEPQTTGNLRACPGLSWDCFALSFYIMMHGNWNIKSIQNLGLGIKYERNSIL